MLKKATSTSVIPIKSRNMTFARPDLGLNRYNHAKLSTKPGRTMGRKGRNLNCLLKGASVLTAMNARIDPTDTASRALPNAYVNELESRVTVYGSVNAVM